MATGDGLSLLGEWRAILRANSLSEATLHQYAMAMFRLLEFHEFRVHPLDLTPAQIAAFLASLGNRYPAKVEYAKGIRSFYSYAVGAGYLLTSPVGLIRPKKVKPQRPVRFEIDELNRIVIAAAWRSPRRAWAIVALVALGLRRSELVGLRAHDIDWVSGEVHVLGKGRKHRNIPLNALAREALTELLALSPDDRVLPVQPNTLSTWVQVAIVDAELAPTRLGRRRTAHTLRATFASLLLDDGIPPQVVQELLGHESLATTSVYGAIGESRTTREAVERLGAQLGAPDSLSR